ncbi:hypothetical protein FBU31_002141 [Coemansia sp. 'formosensis']|nr:hypothetical protein FBU31_002141 [Coemansia sp. 'formosensis']
MDTLLNGIQSQTIDLSALDLIPSFINITYNFYYGNTATDADFMPAELLRKSFYMALLDFPVLVGRLVVDGRGHAKIAVDKDNLNLPNFQVSQSNVHFHALQASKFSWDALPDGVYTAGAASTADASGEMKAANIHVVRLQDNSGIIVFISVAHYVVDGTGYCEFVNRWAELCCWMRRDNAASEPPVCYCSYERCSIFDNMPDGRKALDDPTLEMVTATGPLVRWLAWLSPNTRARLFGTALSRMSVVSHIFHIPPSRLAWLHASVREHLSVDIRLSDNDIITALLTMTVAQSEAESKRDSASATYLSSLASYLFPSMYAPDSRFVTEVLIDTRPRLNGLKSARYTGNSVLTSCLVTSMQSLVDGTDIQSLALIAKSVRQLVNNVDPPYIGQYIDMLHKDPACFMCSPTSALSKTTMLFSNRSRFPLYRADFGDGIPTWVSPIQTFFPNFSSILPTNPSTGGCFIYISMNERVMDRILLNKFWISSAKVVY